MSKNVGNDYGLYLVTAEPTAKSDIDEYDLVGFATELQFTRSRNMIDASNKDSGEDSEFIAGRRTSEISSTFYADETHENDAGQAALEQALESKEGTLYWLITNNELGSVQYYGEAKPSQFDLSMPDEGMIAVECTLQVTGAVTREAVT